MLIFVTVGTTSFDDLVETVTQTNFIKTCQSLGYTTMRIQRGKGSFVPNEQLLASQFVDFFIEIYEYKKCIANDIMSADLVISHAGAGCCLEVLESCKPLVVVINETLMGNHQVELAARLAQDDHLYYTTCKQLNKELKTMDFKKLKPYQRSQNNFFSLFLDDLMGFRNKAD